MSPSFIYCIVLPEPHPDQPDMLPFQGISRRVADRMRLVETIVQWPPNPVELFVSREKGMALRRMGASGYRILPVAVSALSHVAPASIAANAPTIVITDEETDRPIRSWLAESEAPVLHVTTSVNENILHTNSVTRATLVDLWIRYAEQYPGQNQFGKQPSPAWEPFPVRIHIRNHLCTAPSEGALRSIGATFEGELPISASSGDEPLVEAMAKIAHTIQDLPYYVTDGLQTATSSLIVSGMSLSQPWHQRNQRRRLYRQLPRAVQPLLKALHAQERYALVPNQAHGHGAGRLRM